MDKIFSLPIDVINGEVKEFASLMYFKCDQLLPIGEAIVRYFDEEMCQVAKKTFYLNYGGQLLGTPQFKTITDFWKFQKLACCGDAYDLFIDGCQLLIDGQKMSI
jgi:hypothetical protein